MLLIDSCLGGLPKAIGEHGGLAINAECDSFLERLGTRCVEKGHVIIRSVGSLSKAKYVVHAGGTLFLSYKDIDKEGYAERTAKDIPKLIQNLGF